MKRRALLLGNSNGQPGIKADLKSFLAFLGSDIGGHWREEEITLLMNPIKERLLLEIRMQKYDRPDFLLVIYSGYDAYSKGSVLEINGKRESVHEHELKNIAPRQVMLFDSCHTVSEMTLTDSINSVSSTLSETQVAALRKAYEHRILQSIEQQVSLYACSAGECSCETPEGGIYTASFLASVIPDYPAPCKTVFSIQDEARQKTSRKTWELFSRKQTPDQISPRCFLSEQLIIAINPQNIIL